MEDLMADDRFVEDPVARFTEITQAVSGSRAELSEEALRAVMADKEGDDAKTDAAASQIAAHSTLTEQQAKTAIAPSIKAASDGDKAKAASEAAAGAGAAADVELSDPVMLKSWGRVVFAAIQALVVALASILLAFRSMSNDAAIGLAVIAVLNSIGILVLVMGYKNVTIKGSPGHGCGHGERRVVVLSRSFLVSGISRRLRTGC